MRKDAFISGDGQYRYSLLRHWGSEKDWIAIGKLKKRAPRVVWVMLNPSTADAEVDDQTIRKCIGFTKQWGLESFVVINLFALRATHPSVLKKSLDPCGQENLKHWVWHLRNTYQPNDIVIAAWGNHGSLFGMSDKFKADMCRDISVECLGFTKKNQPKHPLRLPYETGRLPFND